MLLVRCGEEEVTGDLHPMMFLFVHEQEDGTFTGTILVSEGGHFGPLAGDSLGPFPRVRDLAIEAKTRGDAFLKQHLHLFKDHK